MRHFRRLLALLVAASLVAGAGAAHAARITLHSANLFATSSTHPCPGQGNAAPAPSGASVVSSVTITLPSAGCSGLPVQVTVVSGGALSQGSGSAVGAVATVALSAPFTVTSAVQVQVTAGGWQVPVTWTYTAPDPVYQGNSPTWLTTLTWTLVSNNPVQACFTATVTTSSPTPVEWRVTMDLSRAPFNGASASGFSFQGPDGWRYQWYPNTPSAGLLQIGGTIRGERRTVASGQSYDVQVCNWSLPPGVQTPSAYTVSTTQTTWTSTRACLATTVSGNGSERFYFAWTALVDMRPALDKLASAGHPLSAYTYSSNEWMLTRAPAPDVGAGVFRVTANSPADLHLSDTFTFETCANFYG